MVLLCMPGDDDDNLSDRMKTLACGNSAVNSWCAWDSFYSPQEDNYTCGPQLSSSIWSRNAWERGKNSQTEWRQLVRWLDGLLRTVVRHPPFTRYIDKFWENHVWRSQFFQHYKPHDRWRMHGRLGHVWRSHQVLWECLGWSVNKSVH